MEIACFKDCRWLRVAVVKETERKESVVNEEMTEIDKILEAV